MFSNVYQGRRVWLSGHTGFKGSWLAEWLLSLGAEVYGFSIGAPTRPALFEQLGLDKRLHHEVGDLREADAVRTSMLNAKPDFVFHLAAQSLVRPSYEDPVATFAINVMGSVHVLDALRAFDHSCAVVMVTTDKCYENREWVHGYREEDPMGGWDPYSSSKGMAELAIASYRRSFFGRTPVRIASARAGNVIGGGDWATNRILPDCIRALRAGAPIQLRNPHAMRPWQHVLEPLSGYLLLGARLATAAEPDALLGAFNFGPGHDANRTVRELATEVLRHIPGTWHDQSNPAAPHEAELLSLATEKARHLLGWRPVWDFTRTVAETARWYLADHLGKDDVQARTRDQITAYQTDARARQLVWACS